MLRAISPAPPEDCLARFAAGDGEAFESLFRDFQGAVFGWIVKIVRDRTAAEELTVETFWRIYRSHARFDPGRGSFAAWARRIATNVAISHLQRSGTSLPVPAEVEAAPVADPAVREAIRRAFVSLPAKLQVTAVLALIEEEPYDVIAEAQGISVGAVKSRVFRAVRLLRKKLERMGIKP